MIAAVLALMLASAAPAASRPAPPSPQQQLAMLGQVLAAHGMSPAGVAKVKDSLKATSIRSHALGEHLQAAGLALHNAASATPFNPAAFEAAMRAHKAAVLAMASAEADGNIAAFQQLSPADKHAFAITVTGGPAVAR